jgi:hypothetical protein
MAQTALKRRYLIQADPIGTRGYDDVAQSSGTVYSNPVRRLTCAPAKGLQ